MIEIRVPATSANLGPGYDVLGLALNLYNTYKFQEIPHGLEMTGFEDEYNNQDNLVYTSMLKTFDILGYRPKGIRIIAETQIPTSRGLGSSAACILGGVLGANCLGGGSLSEDQVFEIAVDIEGHPDNIAPALFGGLVTSIREENQIYYNHINIAEGLKFIALIPDFTLSTKEARAVLPREISHLDGVYNTARLALLLSALSNGRFDLLKHALKDRFHQPYRGKLIEGFDAVVAKCEELGSLGVYLSGAGPTIMALVEDHNESLSLEIKDYFISQGYNWDVKELSLDLKGAICKF